MRALTVSVVALLAVVCIADEAIVCSTVLGKHNCFQDFDNCQWTGQPQENTCQMSVDCTQIEGSQCSNFFYSKECNTIGTALCSAKPDVCAYSATQPCDTASGCTKGVQTCVANGDFNCKQFNNVANACSQSASYCMQDPAIQTTCVSNGFICPAATTENLGDCTGPCTVKTVTCADTCRKITGPIKCASTTGCQYDAQTQTCKAFSACATITDQALCTAENSGCKITGYNCPSDPVANNAYCTKNLSTCSSGAVVKKYCNLVGKSCVDDPKFCDKTYLKGCTPTVVSPKCTATFNCSNPGKCTEQIQLTTCNQKLCDWTDTRLCSNKITNHQCNILNTSATDCNTLATEGCVFTEGGSCSEKSSGNDTISASVLTFITALTVSVVLSL